MSIAFSTEFCGLDICMKSPNAFGSISMSYRLSSMMKGKEGENDVMWEGKRRGGGVEGEEGWTGGREGREEAGQRCLN